MANLKTGALHIIGPLDPSAINEVNTDPNLRVVSVPGGRRVHIGFNTTLKPVDDVKVRQALNYGTDIESITKTILGGTTTRMKTFVNAPNDNSQVAGYTYDPAKAKQLLTEAGYPNGFDIKFDVDNRALIGRDEFPQAIAASLRNINVRVSINMLERNGLTQLILDRKTNPMYLYGIAGAFDPGQDIKLFNFGDVNNGTQWRDEKVQSLLKQLETGGTPEQRKQWSYDAQAIIADQAPMLFLWKQPDITGATKRVQNYKPTGDERIRIWELTLSG